MCYLFLDTEFTDFTNMDLISIGLVSEDGKHEFYRENTSHIANYRSDFVNKVVMPLLEGSSVAVSYEWISHDLVEWLNALPVPAVTIVADYAGDWHLMKPLLDQDKLVKPLTVQMLTYSFNEMLTFRGYNELGEMREEAVRKMMSGQSEYYTLDQRIHHALVDAKSNRHGWIKGYEYVKGLYA